MAKFPGNPFSFVSVRQIVIYIHFEDFFRSFWDFHLENPKTTDFAQTLAHLKSTACLSEYGAGQLFSKLFYVDNKTWFDTARINELPSDNMLDDISNWSFFLEKFQEFFQNHCYCLRFLKAKLSCGLSSLWNWGMTLEKSSPDVRSRPAISLRIRRASSFSWVKTEPSAAPSWAL